MFNSKLKPTESDAARKRVATVPLTQRLASMKYPPRSKTTDKGKINEESRKRAAQPSSSDSSKRKKDADVEILEPAGVPTPNQLLFHRRILKVDDPKAITEYLQGLCPSGDRPDIDGYSQRKFTMELNAAASQFIPLFSRAVYRATAGYVDPEQVEEYKLVKAELAAKRSKVTEMTDLLRTKEQEHKAEVEVLTKKLATLEERETEKVAAARIEGRSEYLLSEEGLRMVDLIREVHKEAVLYSPDFIQAIIDVVPEYGVFIIERAKKWVEEGKSIEDFTVTDGLYDAPSVPRTVPSAEQLEMQNLGAKELVEYIQKLEVVASPTESLPEQVKDSLTQEYHRVRAGEDPGLGVSLEGPATMPTEEASTSQLIEDDQSATP